MGRYPRLLHGFRVVEDPLAERDITGTTKVSVDVLNTGNRTRSEVVQLYIQDVIATVATPRKELRGFKKVNLTPRDTKTVSFELGSDELSLFNRNLDRVVEPGEFEKRGVAVPVALRAPSTPTPLFSNSLNKPSGQMAQL